MTEKSTAEYKQAVSTAARMLQDADRVLILSHLSPDGDTLGSAFALCRALQKLGKQARVACSDELPGKYDYIYAGVPQADFEPTMVVSSDIASPNLLGEPLAQYAGRIALCIDHHPSNTHYAGFTLLDAAAAATCEIMRDVIDELRVEIDNNIADCIYTGLATDTGCFRYSNTTPKTLRTAALIIEKGAQAAVINKRMFETLSAQRMAAEALAMHTLEYYFDRRVAVIYVTRNMIAKTGVKESELEGIPSIPARIEGVAAGVTVKEKAEGCCKISVRTNGRLNASDICAILGGGGHAAAAGCTVTGGVENAKNAILAAVGKVLNAS